MADAQKRLWIDGHVHLFHHLHEEAPLDYALGDVLTIMDRSDADLRFICSDNAAAGVWRIVREPDALHEMNERLYRTMIHPSAGRLLGSVQIDPRAVKQSHEDLDLYIGERNYVLVGEVEGMPYGFDLDTPEMIELVRHAARLGTPVQLHCSTNVSPTGEHMRQALHVAREVPEAQVIIAHAIGGRNSYQYILAAETYFAQGGDNLHLEIMLFNVREWLRAAYEHLGADRLLVGTDWGTYHAPPFDPYGTHITQITEPGWWRNAALHGKSQWDSVLWLSSQLALDLNETPYPCAVSSYVGFLREAGVSEEDIVKIGSGNSIRLFKLKEKGLI